MTDPSDGLDGLIERINALADCSYWANAGWDIPGDATQVIGRLAVQAAAALVQLREENARHGADMKLLRDEVTRLKDHYEYEILAGENDCKKHAGKVYMNCVVCRAERAEAEVLILRNDLATYAERIAALEAERDALAKDAERYRWLRGCMWWRTDPFAQDVGNMGTGYWQTKLFKQVVGKPDLDAAIDAAREKP